MVASGFSQTPYSYLASRVLDGCKPLKLQGVVHVNLNVRSVIVGGAANGRLPIGADQNIQHSGIPELENYQW
jgi:hypothetical protein